MFLWKSFPNFSEPAWFKMSNVGAGGGGTTVWLSSVFDMWKGTNKGERLFTQILSYRFRWEENNWGGGTWAVVHVQDGLRDLCFISTVTQRWKAENVVLCALSRPKNVF